MLCRSFAAHMKYSFITVEGNIGAGKTTLANMLSNHYGTKLILEQFADNPFLPKFYEKPEQYAFPLELFFMAERYKQLKDMLHTQDLFQQNTVSDYLFTKCLLFAKVTLPEEEFKLYQKLFDIIHPQIVKPDLLIYLHSPVTKLQENIKKRNRHFEQNIPDSYLLSVQETYLQYIKQHEVKTLFVDASNTDFLHQPAHFRFLLDALDKDYEPGLHPLTIPD